MLLQVMVTVLLIVLSGTPRTYFFTVNVPVALLPLFDGTADVTFHASSYIVYDVVAFVQVAELPV